MLFFFSVRFIVSYRYLEEILEERDVQVDHATHNRWVVRYSFSFFKQAIDANGFAKKVVTDKSGANYAGLENINILLMLAGFLSFVEIGQVKYLNNLIEQDHCFIKKITKSMMGFKAFHSAKATIEGIEAVHMI
jgi:putative transposase